MELRGLIGPETEYAYRQAIKLDPTFGPSYAHLGRLLRRRGKMDQSTQAYADALHHSTDVPTMILVAETMQSEQRYKESEQILQEAVKKDPKNPAGLLLLGRALTTLEEFVEAETVLRRSLSVSPNGFMANSLLGTLYARQGRIELAENALLQAARSVPAYEKRRLSQQFEMVGDEYIKAGKRAEATRAYKQAVSLDAETESLSAKLARARTD
jgi:cytochrome c-type biogenesis protein CcmH/NrfG